MNARITDATALTTLRPLEVVSYLRSNGWTKSREKAGEWSTWVCADHEGEEFEITVPLKHQFRDFAVRMGDVLQVLESFEGRSQLQIFHDLMVIGAEGGEFQTPTNPGRRRAYTRQVVGWMRRSCRRMCNG